MTDRETTGGAVVVDPLGGLLLDPSNELRFKGPFDDYVTVSLVIRNPTDKRIAFKIKTTAPKRYCVKPNSGVLDHGQSMKVNVLLQPFQYDPNEKNKHKFMVQYLYLNDEEVQMSVNDILNMWKDVNTNRLLDLKLKCIFEPHDSEQQKTATAQINDANTSTMSNYSAFDVTAKQQPPAAAKEPTPAQVAAAAAAAPIAPPAQPITRQTTRQSDNFTNADSNDFESKAEKTKSATLAGSASSTPATVKKETVNVRTSDKTDNLSNELKAVQKENEALKNEIANLREAEIRLRKLALSSSSSTGKQAQAASLADLLQNKLVLVIAVLVAIIFYLLLFR